VTAHQAHPQIHGERQILVRVGGHGASNSVLGGRVVSGECRVVCSFTCIVSGGGILATEVERVTAAGGMSRRVTCLARALQRDHLSLTTEFADSLPRGSRAPSASRAAWRADAAAMDDIEDLIKPETSFQSPARPPLVGRSGKQGAAADDVGAIAASRPCDRSSSVPGTQAVWVRTFGCAHNTSDAEYMAGALQGYGYR